MVDILVVSGLLAFFLALGFVPSERDNLRRAVLLFGAAVLINLCLLT